MAIPDAADQHFTYESRLASFQTAQQVSKRRASNASTKAPKSIKWPHKFLAPEELAKAGFFYYPLQVNPDNVACFLCHKSLDGWEEDDDPLAEHLKHSPDCGWAIVASIERQDGETSQEYPSSARMIEARKATFAGQWPHESKKGWKCKVKQMVDAGWKYTPTSEYDDMATCTYCSLALDGWEPSDKPLDEHFSRSPDCPFFALINDHKQSPVVKRTKSKKDRSSKISRLSTQSSFTVASDAASVADVLAEEGDSILTTATATQGGKKMGRGKKAGTGKGRKTKAKKSDVVEVAMVPEPEDADFEVKVDVAPKSTRAKKRKSDEIHDPVSFLIEAEAPVPKRRATRTRGSVAVGDAGLGLENVGNSVSTGDLPKSTGTGRIKGRISTTRSSRKASATSLASLRATAPNDDEIDAALEADLHRLLSHNEETLDAGIKQTVAGPTQIANSHHAMFGIGSVKVDEAAIETELQAMELESRPPPKAKVAKGKQPRKPSGKQQAAAKKAAEAEAEAQRRAEEGVSQQISSELEHSVSMQHSSPVAQPKRQRATSRQPSRQLPTRSTRASVFSGNETNIATADDWEDIAKGVPVEVGNDTDLSVASQSTVVRGSSNRGGNTDRNWKSSKKVASRNIEEIVRGRDQPSNGINNVARLSMGNKDEIAEDLSTTEEKYYTPAPESHETMDQPSASTNKAKTSKPRGRPPKSALSAAAATVPTTTLPDTNGVVQEPTLASTSVLPISPVTKLVNQIARSSTPPLIERTPSQSPQSSDAENHPPSSKPSAIAKKAATPHSNKTRIPLTIKTPAISPSKRNVIAGLQTLNPWTPVDLDLVFLKSPGDENVTGDSVLNDAVDTLKDGGITSPEKKMTVEEWIYYNAEMAEEKLRDECERMVGTFEREGTRAMSALEGVECVE